ncbi:MAG TPA: hypothetical protein VNQ77_12235 [Frankiaceae bacterium]|nr:hypothetical protein [Frankiaceae bacterium]
MRRIARPPLQRLIVMASATTAAAVLGSLLNAHHAAAVRDPNMLATRATFPGGAPAPGAEFTLRAQPDPVLPTAPVTDPANDARLMPEQVAGTGVADANGYVTMAVQETPALVALAREQGGVVKAVLGTTAQQDVGGVPVYFKVVSPVSLRYDETAREFLVPEVGYQGVLPMPEYDATILQQLGEKTLAEVGVLAGMADPVVAKAAVALQQAMNEEGFVTDNELLAYNIHTADGMVTWLTYSAQNIAVRETDDYDVYQILPLTSGGFPAVDTTDTGDAIDSVSGIVGLDSQTKSERGYWSNHHGDCYAIVGPRKGADERWQRTMCYAVDHQEMDTTKGTSYWQFRQRASGTSLNGWDMLRLWVHGQPYYHGTAPMSIDGIPEPNTTDTKDEGPCDTVTHTISAESGSPIKFGYSRSWEKVICNTSWYGPVSGKTAPGDWASYWRHSSGIGSGTFRLVRLVTPVRTPTKEGTPIWNILSGQWVD